MVGMSVAGAYSRDADVRFWAYVVRNGDDECWAWLGAHDKDGYARFKDNYKSLAAHRVIYEKLVGPIPDELTIDHLCRNQGCLNPAHLEPVTSRENTLRSDALGAVNARKTHCKRGHEFVPANIYWSRGYRSCKRCNLDWQAFYRGRGPRPA